MKLADLERHLKQHGCVLYRKGGNHSIGRNTNNGKITSVPRHREVKENTAKAICKQLDLPLP